MNKLKEIFAKVLNLPTEQVTDSLSPDNCPAWDSLNAIILVTEIEKAYNIKFTFPEAMAVKNFGDAVKLVASKGVDFHE
jgi:acyl carrier protein